MSHRLVALVIFLSAVPPVLARSQQDPAGEPVVCVLDLNLVGQMEDILSNALMLGLGQPEAQVQEFLKEARKRCTTGPELLREAAGGFGLHESALTAEVERFRHINCAHEKEPLVLVTPAPNDLPTPNLTTFASNVTTHVILHELGHALIREFDIPILGNEEAAADAFATHFLTAHMPDRALEVLKARIESLMFEANEVPRAEWTFAGEHDHDARRAYQIAALALAADPKLFEPLASTVSMSESQIRKATDYGADIHRSWRRTLAPLMMPSGSRSNEAGVKFDTDKGIIGQLHSAGLIHEMGEIVARFDWHSKVTIHFSEAEGRAAWSRSTRTIFVSTQYIQRFITQGESIGRPK